MGFLGTAKTRLRRAAWILATGRDGPIPDDEKIRFSLGQYAPLKDAQLAGKRLNVIVPTLSSKKAFGGVSTLVDLPMAVFVRGLRVQNWRLRYICDGPAPAAGDNVLIRHTSRHGLDPNVVEVLYNAKTSAGVSVGAGDVFLGSLWHSLSAVRRLLNFQQAEFAQPPTPYISLVQDYEPGFHPWSSAYLLGMAAYNSEYSHKVIFNSKELADFYAYQKHPVDHGCHFDPVMNTSLRDALQAAPPTGKDRRILVYGRPTERRNAFYVTSRALEIWSETYADAPRWTVVSAGEDHRPFRLARGVSCRVKGKLTLEGYIEELQRSAVGLSLMVSPHPSYPPLEMAHFGARTITNSFLCKDLTSWHENIVSVDIAEPENIADALAKACAGFEADPDAGWRAQTRKPGYLEDFDPIVLDKLGALIADE